MYQKAHILDKSINDSVMVNGLWERVGQGKFSTC